MGCCAANVDQKAVQKADGFLTMLHQLSEMGAVMRQVMTNALTNPLSYRILTGPAARELQHLWPTSLRCQSAAYKVPISCR